MDTYTERTPGNRGISSLRSRKSLSSINESDRRTDCSVLYSLLHHFTLEVPFPGFSIFCIGGKFKIGLFVHFLCDVLLWREALRLAVIVVRLVGALLLDVVV